MNKRELNSLLKNYDEVVFNYSNSGEGVFYLTSEVKRIISELEFEIEEAEEKTKSMFVTEDSGNHLMFIEGVFHSFTGTNYILEADGIYFKIDAKKVLSIYPINS